MCRQMSVKTAQQSWSATRHNNHNSHCTSVICAFLLVVGPRAHQMDFKSCLTVETRLNFGKNLAEMKTWNKETTFSKTISKTHTILLTFLMNTLLMSFKSPPSLHSYTNMAAVDLPQFDHSFCFHVAWWLALTVLFANRWPVPVLCRFGPSAWVYY